MTSWRLVGVAAALLAAASGVGGCVPSMTGAPGDAGATADPGSSSQDQAATSQDGSEIPSPLGELAVNLAASDASGGRAFSQGYGSVSTNPDYAPPGWYPPGFDPYGLADSGDEGAGSPSGFSPPDAGGGYGAPGSGGPGSGPGDGGDQGSGSGAGDGYGGGCQPPEGWHGWPGQYRGTLECAEHESLEGYGEMSQNWSNCVSMSFDSAGVPAWIPIPVFARDAELLQVDVHFPGETKTYSWWVYDVKVQVVSATYTPTTADVVLNVDLSWYGQHSSIRASGVQHLQTEMTGDGLHYTSHMHYEGNFWADTDPGDWNADATQDMDYSGTLGRS